MSHAEPAVPEPCLVAALRGAAETLYRCAMNVGDLVRAMEAIAPIQLAAPWDNVGLLVGDPGSDIERVLLTIDCVRSVLDEAESKGCGAVVAYHPPIFEAQRRFVAGSIAHDSARARIAIYSPHTALDAAEGGTNDVLADAAGMLSRAPLHPCEARDAGGASVGFGRVGPVARTTLDSLAERTKGALGLSSALVAGPPDCAVERVAVCAGSGGELLSDAIEARADAFVTGELRHHDALRALSAGLGVVCLLHTASERAVLGRLQARLQGALGGVDVLVSKEDREPFRIV